jgi:hypothetical protein
MLTAGNPVTKQTVDNVFGSLAVALARIEMAADQVNVWLTSASDGDLTGFGYTTDDIAALRACASSAALLAQIYAGAVNLPTATDFKTSIQLLAGLGSA